MGLGQVNGMIAPNRGIAGGAQQSNPAYLEYLKTLTPSAPKTIAPDPEPAAKVASKSKPAPKEKKVAPKPAPAAAAPAPVTPAPLAGLAGAAAPAPAAAGAGGGETEAAGADASAAGLLGMFGTGEPEIPMAPPVGPGLRAGLGQRAYPMMNPALAGLRKIY